MVALTNSPTEVEPALWSAEADDPASAADDATLLTAVASGDERAYATLVHRHADRIYAYLLRLTRSHADAQDLVQDTFFRVWRSARSYRRDKARAATWIQRIAHNVCIDSFRRQRPGEHVELDSLDTSTPEQLTSVDLESTWATRRALVQVESAIGRLPENQRAALVLCQLQGFSNSEAAMVLGIRVRAVESLLARARRTLRLALEQGDDHG